MVRPSLGGTHILHPSAFLAGISTAPERLYGCRRILAACRLGHGRGDGRGALWRIDGVPLRDGRCVGRRLLLTGALHEDGLADFFDGFGGGGRDRQRILDIMKDSHIGTYGVLALIVYLALLFFALHSLQPMDAALTILAVDPYAKMVSAQVIQMMPYARTAETAKNKTVYRKFSPIAGIGLSIQGLLPVGLYLWWMQGRVEWSMLIFLPCLTMYFLYLFIWRRLRGYTGDCCGALFLLTELTAYLVVSYCLA